MSSLSIGVVGGLRVATSDGKPLKISSRKAQALLGCLALEPGTPQGRDFLAALLWPDSDPELARASLRQALAALRRALPPAHADALGSDSGSVWLDATTVASDLARFRASLRSGAFEAPVSDVPTGELMAGLEATSFAFEQWLEQQRGVFRRQRIEALEQSAARSAAAGDLEGQRAALERLLSLEPVQERAHRALMDVLARLGHWTDALRQYRTCREALRRELDVATEPATDALYRDLLRRRRQVDPAASEEDGADAAAPAPATPRPAPQAPPLLRDAVVLDVQLGPAAAGEGDDPERGHEIELARLAAARAVTERFGGLVHRASAGEVLAVFGLDAVTGNEAERAARAAVQLLDGEGSAIYACGIDAGQVLPGDAGGGTSLTGRAVTRARELARLAHVGETLASDGLVARLRDAFEHEPVPLAGEGASAHRVRLRGAGLRPARPFVGRRAELALLTNLLERVASSRRARVVVVRGEAGIGKSAIIESLVRAARERKVRAHVLPVFDFGQAALERPVPALAARLLDLEPGRAQPETAARLETAVARGLLAAEDRVFVADLVGAMPAGEPGCGISGMDNSARTRARAAALHRLAQRAAAEPLLIVIEDMHWSDPSELAAIADLAAALAAHPVLVVLSVRADDDPLDPAWRARIRGCPMTTLDLAPLDQDESRELAAVHGDWPAVLLERCLDLAGGHPLFLEQLLRASASGESQLPGSVRALLLRRVERLEPDTQQALQAAAVLGHRFALDALRHVLGAPGFDDGALEASGLVVADAGERRFAHALIRDAVYESLLGSSRRELHRRAAAWFAPRDTTLAADHLAAAGDPGASGAYVKAAGDHLRTCRLERALSCAGRACELARDPASHSAARAVLGEVQIALGRAGEACDTYRLAIELADDSESRARGWLGLATALRILDRYDEALGALDHAARELAEDDHRRRARLWTLRGNLHFPRGELDLCLEAHRQALDHARQSDSLEDVVRAFGGIGDAQYQRGRMRSADAEFRRCVELAAQHGLRTLELAYLPMVAVTELYLGEPVRALETCATALAAATEQRDQRSMLLADGVACSAQLVQAEFAMTLERAERCIALAQDIGARRFEAENRALRGLALLGLNEHARARAALEESAELSRAVCPTYSGPWAIAAYAFSLADDEPRARALLAEGAQLLARGCVSHNYLEYHHYAMEACARWRDWSGVRAHADALERYMSAESLPWAEIIIDAHRAIATQATTPGPGAVAGLQAALERARAHRFLTLVPLLEQTLATA